MEDRLSFHDAIRKNKIKSVFLMAIIISVFIALAYVIGLIYQQDAFLILIAGIIISIFYVLISYYNADRIALASVGAQGADPVKFRQLHNLVEGICIASGLPKPRVYIMPGKQINAFATGRDPQHSVICFTEGALKKLNKHELEGVVSHELSHISNYDIRFMTLTAIMVGMIAIVSEIFLRTMWHGNHDNKKGGAILIVIGIVLAILAPIVVQLVQLAISRKREFAADASAVKFTRSPTGLIGALKKIKQDSEPMKVSGAVAPLFISNPRVSSIFSTHPPIEKRIKMLESM